jgi:hypothetical protein
VKLSNFMKSMKNEMRQHKEKTWLFLPIIWLCSIMFDNSLTIDQL